MTINELASAVRKMKKQHGGESKILVMTDQACIDNAEIIYTMAIDETVIIRFGTKPE